MSENSIEEKFQGVGLCVSGCETNRLVVVAGAVAVNEAEQVAVILATLLLKLVVVSVAQSLKELLLKLHWLLVRFQVPL